MPSSKSESYNSPPTKAPPGMIWLRPERTGRGPEPSHSRAAIAAAAIALADAEGVGAVSMRKIAAAVGAGTMSLYNYVATKEHLFDLMLDAVVSEFAIPDEPSGDPREDLALLAREELAAMRRHPWLAQLSITRPSVGPGALRNIEFFLGALADAPLSGGTKLEMFAHLNGFVAQFAEWERTTISNASTQHVDLAAYLSGVLANGSYPNLAAALADSSGSPLDAEAIFTSSLDRLLSAFLRPPS
ncbi:TetR/AcrR family transcriptional regulator C-terminal domain-containing protein [Streptomyces sp. NPDC052101]|uniref:TetR/AcrR family transcriptional regulator n=1 Tax=Streptomyces sp. NPDC052101 TaxID=3155763 RepID=UPI003433E44B